MLHPGDHDLIDCNPEIPGLRVVLDPDAVADLVRRRMPSGAISQSADSIQATYVRFKPGTNCLVGYRVRCGDADLHFYVKAYSRRSREKLADFALSRNSVGIQRCVLDAPLGIGFCTWAADCRIGAAARLAHSSDRDELWDRVLFADGPYTRLQPGQQQILAYKPERRLVLKVESQHGPAVLKAYTSPAYAEIASRVRRLPEIDGLRTPRRIGRSNRHQVLAFEWMAGELLAAAHPTTASPESTEHAPVFAQDVATALAALHNGDPGKGCWHAAPSTWGKMSAATTAITALAPKLDAKLRAILNDLQPILDRPDPAGCLVHNDCTPDQFLRLPTGALALLDWDQAGLGDPMTDLAAYMADCLVRDLYSHNLDSHSLGEISLTAWLRAPAITAWLEAYRHNAPANFSGPRLAAHLAARLLRLAPESFRRRRATWRAELHTIVQLAHDICAQIPTLDSALELV